MSSKAVATAKSDQLPAFLADKMTDTRGSEEIGTNDLTIPRIELVQSLSACRKKNDPAYIPGIEEGMLYNNVTRENYGETVDVVPVYFRKEYLVWRDQDLGGGFGGSHQSMAEAEQARQTQEKPEEWEIVDTSQQFVLVVKEDGSAEEAVLSMAKSKAKVSRNWNSLIRINGGPRFSRVYRISGVGDQNPAGQDYFNLSVSNVGFVTEEIFSQAEHIYELIKSGQASADSSFDGMDEM